MPNFSESALFSSRVQSTFASTILGSPCALKVSAALSHSGASFCEAAGVQQLQGADLDFQEAAMAARRAGKHCCCFRLDGIKCWHDSVTAAADKDAVGASPHLAVAAPAQERYRFELRCLLHQASHTSDAQKFCRLIAVMHVTSTCTWCYG